MSFKIATPISHLFKDKNLAKKIVSFSDMLELRDNNIKFKKKCSLIYHSDLNILAKWSNNEIRRLSKLNKKYQIKLTSYHLASRYQNNKIINGKFIGIGRPFSNIEMKNNIRANVKTINNIFGKNTPILVENNNYLCTDAYNIITDAQFIYEIIKSNDIYLLLDMAHAEITAFNKNLDFIEYMKQLPIERYKQIHICGFSVICDMAFDSHSELQKSDWQKLLQILKIIKVAEYISIEYYKNGNILINQLKMLRKIQREGLIND